MNENGIYILTHTHTHTHTYIQVPLPPTVTSRDYGADVTNLARLSVTCGDALNPPSSPRTTSSSSSSSQIDTLNPPPSPRTTTSSSSSSSSSQIDGVCENVCVCESTFSSSCCCCCLVFGGWAVGLVCVCVW
jgi:hypothetical protein